MSHPKYNFGGASALVGAAFIYGMFAVLARQMAEMWSDQAQVLARFIVALLILVCIGLFAKPAKLSKDKLIVAVALGIVFWLVVILYTISINKTTIANSVFMLYAASLLTSFIVGTLWFKERVTKIKLAALFLAFCGIAVYSHALLALNLGIVAGLASGVFDGISGALRKTLSNTNRFAVLRVQYGVGVLIGIALTIASSSPPVRHVSVSGIAITIIYGLLLVCLGSLLLYGFQHFDINIATVIVSCELIFATLLGWIFYHEMPTLNELIGGALIFLASVLGGMRMKTKKAQVKLA